MCNCVSNFHFNLAKWQGVCIPPAPPPVGAPITLTLDPSFTAHAGASGYSVSDHSAIAAGFISDEDGSLTLLDGESGWWKGLALPHRVVDWVEKYPSATLKIEKNPFFDLLSDSICLEAALRCIQPPRIVPFVPVSSKKKRIARLQELLDADPPTLRIHKGSFVWKLLEQVGNFCFVNSQNHRHEDGLLDVTAMQAGFR